MVLTTFKSFQTEGYIVKPDFMKLYIFKSTIPNRLYVWRDVLQQGYTFTPKASMTGVKRASHLSVLLLHCRYEMLLY